MNFDSMYWNNLKIKYQATLFTNDSPILKLILAKAELALSLNDFEKHWLKENHLLATLQIVEDRLQEKDKLATKLRHDFQILTSKYKAICSSSWKDNSLYLILLKFAQEDPLTESELVWLQKQSRSDIQRLVTLNQKINDFFDLKSKYKIYKRPDLPFDSPLYSILQRMEKKEISKTQDIQYLQKHQLDDTLNIIQQKEAKEVARFTDLRNKYKVIDYSDTSISNPLYAILKKIEIQVNVNESEIKWILENNLFSVHFALLKVKYQAVTFEDLSLQSHLYKVLKYLEQAKFPLLEPDINFLKKRKLVNVIAHYIEQYTNQLIDKIKNNGRLTDKETEWLKQNNQESVLNLAQQQLFSRLKDKYNVSDFKAALSSPLYTILQKLEQSLRLDAIDVAWLEANQLLKNNIYLGYHTIEANFYEEEYKLTGNLWNVPNASSHWRKVKQPERALQLTESINNKQITENKLRAAILTTKGGAYRDLEKYEKAENCAKEAMEYQPENYYPYTLMGAICYDTGRYPEGDYWFTQAIARGASPREIDTELKRAIEKAKGEEKQKIISYLLRKDKERYAWVRKYAK